MNRLRQGFRLLASSFAATALCVPIFAVPVWTGLAEENDNWSNAANWSEEITIGGSDTTVLQFDGSSRVNPHIDTAWTVKTLTFNAGADSFFITGEQPLTFASAAVIENNSSAMQFIANNAIVLNGTSTWNTAIGDFEVYAAISGTGSITKTGAGTLAISGTNTYSGGTTVSDGVVHFATGSLSSGSITINGGQLRWSEGNTDALSGAITLGTNGGTLNTNGNDVSLAASLTGAGSFTKTGAGVLTLTTAGNSTGGTTTVTGGTLKLGVAGALPGSKALVVNGSEEAGATFDLNGQNLTVSSLTFGGVNEAGSATNNVSTGSGTLTLGGAVTYSSANGDQNHPGAATISGKLALGSSPRTFTIHNSDNTNAELTISAVISGSGGLTKAGEGALVLSGANTYSGTYTTVTGGALRISDAANLPSTTNLRLNGGVLELAGDVALTYGTGAGKVQFTGSGGFSAFGADRTVSYQSGAALTWNTSSFVAAGNAFMLSSTSSNSMVTFANNIALGTAERTVQVADGSAAIDATLSGVLSGASGSLNKTGNGTLRLSGANTYTTKTTISEGTVIFAKPASFNNGSTNWTVAKLVVAGGATAAFNVGGTGEFTTGNIDSIKALGNDNGGFQGDSFLGLDTTNASGGNFAYASTITNLNSNAITLGLAKLGTGSLTLSGTNTYTGGTSLRGGVLNLASSGAIGTSGAITFSGGTLQFTAANKKDYSARFSSAENQQFKLDTNGQSVTLASALAPNSTLTKLGTGTLTLSGSGSNEGLFATVDAGTLVLSKTSSDDVQAVRNGLTINSGGTAKLAGTGGNQIGGGATVTVNSGGTFDLNNRSETIGALNGAGTVTNSSASNTSTLTIGEYGERDSVFSGVLQNGTGVLALHHIENATLTLSGANTYTGGTTLSNEGVVVLGSAGALGTVGTITLNGGILKFSAANTMDYSSRFSTEAEQRYNFDTNGQSVTLATALSSDAGSLLKLGTGTLTLSAANSYTGETTIRGGTLALTNDLSLGTTDGQTIVEDGSTLELNNVAIGHEAIILIGSGVGGNGALVGKGTSSIAGDMDLGDNVIISVSSAGTLSLNGLVNNAFTKIGAGTLILGGDVDNSGLSVIADAGNIVLAKDSSEYVHAIAGNLTINNGVTVQLAGTGDDQINVGSFVEVNSGTLDLNGRNEGFAGLTGASAGTVTNSAADTTSLLKIGDGEEGGELTYDGILQNGAGILAIEKAGDALFTLTGTNTYTGGTTLTGGALNLGSASAIGTEGTITFNGGTLQFSADNTTDYSSRFSSETGQQYKFDTNGQSVTFASAITGAEGYFQKLGEGTLTLSGENTVDSWIDILQGTLKVTNDSALGVSGFGAATYIYDGATLELSNVTIEEVISATGNGVDGNGAIFASDSSTLSGVVFLSDNASIGVAVGKTLEVTGIVSTDQIPEASLAKTGSGTLVFSGENTYTGETLVNGGTLLVNGSNESSWVTTVADGATLGGSGTVGWTIIRAGGTLAPGNSPGLLTVNGDLTFEEGSLASFEIGGLLRGIDYDAVDVSGVLTADGTLTVSLSGGFTPTAPEVFDLLDFASFGGSFAQINLPAIDGYTWDTSNLGIDGTIALVAAVPEPSSFAVLAGLASGVFVFLRRRRV